MKCHESLQTAVRYGPDAWLLYFANEVDDAAFERACAISDWLETSPIPYLCEWTIAYTSVLLEFRAGHCPEAAPQLPDSVSEKIPFVRPIKTIPVTYDGPDLCRVAAHTGLDQAEIIRRHCAVTYQVQCLGFAPGFPYLRGLDPQLQTPRLDTPRTMIPAGSVAIAAGQTGIYPLATPGGWNIIGHTDLCLFDPNRRIEQACYLQAGDLVQFSAVNL